MFGIFLLFIFTLMHIYVFWRAYSVPFLRRRISGKLFIGVGVGLWALFFLGRFYGHGATGTFAMALELLGMDWMAIAFLATIPLLAVDIVTGFGLLLPRLAPSLRGTALFAGGLLSVVALVQGMRPPVVQEYEVRLSGLPQEMDGKVIVAMSDLHVGTLHDERWLEARVAQVQAQEPDMVFLLGDIFEGHGSPGEEMLRALHGLSAPMGVWAVLGNHEFHGNNDAGRFLMEDGNFKVLNNAWAEVRPALVLAGVDDLTANHRSGNGDELIRNSLEGSPSGATILLSHTPWHADRAASAGAGLMLSGHTHGGQIWPFGYMVKRRYPLLGGRYEVDGMTVIVCRGTGTWGPRMRLWRPGEIVQVTLFAK